MADNPEVQWLENKMLHAIPEVRDKINAGARLLLAGSEQALRQLPEGNWIGGTTPYFMAEQGGVCSESQIFVTEVPECATEVQIGEYTIHNLSLLCTQAPENGFSFIIIPAGSPSHTAYAENAPNYEGMFERPVVGWIAGVHVSHIGKQVPRVFSGISGRNSSEHAVVMHVALPQGKIAELDTVNVFQPGPGDSFTFPSAGFSAQQCVINGKSVSFVRYLSETKHDCRLPLIADYNGTMVNVSLQSTDATTNTVKFYAPVFPGVEYRLARRVPDYIAAFEAAIRQRRGGLLLWLHP